MTKVPFLKTLASHGWSIVAAWTFIRPLLVVEVTSTKALISWPTDCDKFLRLKNFFDSKSTMQKYFLCFQKIARIRNLKIVASEATWCKIFQVIVQKTFLFLTANYRSEKTRATVQELFSSLKNSKGSKFEMSREKKFQRGFNWPWRGKKENCRTFFRWSNSFVLVRGAT